jgi:hypothetical protein
LRRTTSWGNRTKYPIDSDWAWLPNAFFTHEGRLLAASAGDIPAGSLLSEPELAPRTCFLLVVSLLDSSDDKLLDGDCCERMEELDGRRLCACGDGLRSTAVCSRCEDLVMPDDDNSVCDDDD